MHGSRGEGSSVLWTSARNATLKSLEVEDSIREKKYRNLASMLMC